MLCQHCRNTCTLQSSCSRTSSCPATQIPLLDQLRKPFGIRVRARLLDELSQLHLWSVIGVLDVEDRLVLLDKRLVAFALIVVDAFFLDGELCNVNHPVDNVAGVLEPIGHPVLVGGLG